MRRRTPSFVLAVALGPALALASACSGAQPIDFRGSGSGSGGGSGGGSGSSSGGTTAEDSGSGPVDSGQPVVDSPAPLDVSEPIDTSPVEEPPPSGPSVACPMNGAPATCDPGDYCCVMGDPTQGTQTDMCQASGTSCAGGTTIRCASPADCPSGQVCCGTETTDPNTNTVMYTQVTCAASCTGTSQRTFCDSSASGNCPAATPVCGQSQLLPGYTVCQQ